MKDVSVAASVGLVLPFIMIFCRLSGMFLFFPGLSSAAIPVRVRLAVALCGSCALGLVPRPLPVTLTPSNTLALVGIELTIGAALGLFVRLGVIGVHLAGEVLGSQMTIGQHRSVAPFESDAGGALTHMLNLMVGVSVFSTGTHRVFVGVLAQVGWDVTAAASASNLAVAADAMLQLAGQCFEGGLRLAAPVATLVAGSQIAFGLLTRVAPQLNVWSVGLLTSSALGLAGLVQFVPAVSFEIRRLLAVTTDRLFEVLANGF